MKVSGDHIRCVKEADTEGLLVIARETGLFSEDEARSLSVPILKGHEAHVCVDADDDALLGWTYFGPDSFQPDVCNVFWIGVHPKHQKRGVGARLMSLVEERAKQIHQQRLVVVETSTTLQGARAFYKKNGFSQCGIIEDFYSDGDGKVIFAKKM